MLSDSRTPLCRDGPPQQLRPPYSQTLFVVGLRAGFQIAALGDTRARPKDPSEKILHSNPISKNRIIGIILCNGNCQMLQELWKRSRALIGETGTISAAWVRRHSITRKLQIQHRNGPCSP